MQWFDMLVLALVQGIAEFLPISSSGHLVIIETLMGVQEESPTVEIILHAGTLASILLIYWRQIIAMLTSDRRVIPLLIVGTIPAAIIGVTIKLTASELLKNPQLAGYMLVVTGCLLLTLRFLPPGNTEYQRMTYGQAFLIGCVQAFAILPGISRSGSTIVGGVALGLKKQDAVTFSFLLAIPAILGATVLTLKDLADTGVDSAKAGILAYGAAVSFVVGIASLKWLIQWSQQGRLYWFAAWCIPVGIAVVTMGWFGLLGKPNILPS